MGLPHPAQYFDPNNVCFVVAKYDSLCTKPLNWSQIRWMQHEPTTCERCLLLLSVAAANGISTRSKQLRDRVEAVLRAAVNGGENGSGS